MNNQKYRKLLAIRNRLASFLPGGNARTQDKHEKRSGMQFNGIQVTQAQYDRLLKIQAKVDHLDQVLRRIASRFPPELLAKNPDWRNLLTFRENLSELLPASE